MQWPVLTESVRGYQAMYYEEVPEILVLYWFMIAWYLPDYKPPKSICRITKKNKTRVRLYWGASL